MIHCNSLFKIYKTKNGVKVALEDVSLKVEKGTILGLTGLNGAGKTTLIKILSTLVLPTSGSAFINGYDALKEPSKVRQSIGLSLSSERSFYFRLTGYQNLKFFAAMQEIPRLTTKKKIEELLKILDLWDSKDILFMEYSRGMKSKLELARALLLNPPVLLLDEPTSSIDPVSAKTIQDMLLNLKSQHKTMIVVTHNMSEAENICDRVVVMDKGKIIAEDSPDNLKRMEKKSVIALEFEDSLDVLRFKDSFKNYAETALTIKDSKITIESTKKRHYECNFEHCL